ncbi:MAG TPA: DUF2277 domain-containing protein [Thermodesulfovibrionales bacterium]|nr:DUF2277 domain-containing protein [Thermodesulfovibrionales bacterium]
MCRNIRTLYNFDPPATAGEIREAALQFVRKVSGFTRPSEANEEAFNSAVDQISQTTAALLGSLTTKAPSKNREAELAKTRARAVRRQRH